MRRPTGSDGAPVEVFDDVTRPTDLLAAAFDASPDQTVTMRDFLLLWRRVDNASRARRRRDTEPDADTVSTTRRLDAIGFKVKVMWGALTFAVIAAGGSVLAVSGTLWSKGGDEREHAITLRTLVETTGEHAKLIRGFEKSAARTEQLLTGLVENVKEIAKEVRRETPAQTKSKGTK
jgi:hypothetical protein